MILTLKELAEYLRVNERTILRMLHNGKIQGAKIGGQWRFNGSQIDKVFFPTTPVSDDDVPLSVLTRPLVGTTISRMMDTGRIILDLQGQDGDSVINELTSHRIFNNLVLDVHDLREKCLARESVLSTGVGNGVAIPHPRDPVPTLRVPACVVYGYSKNGVDFHASDGQPVHHFFLLCSQNIELHLHLMGCMARILKDEKFMQGLLKSDTPEEIIKLVMSHERSEFFVPDAATLKEYQA